MNNISTEAKKLPPNSTYNVVNQFHGGQSNAVWPANAWQTCRETFHHNYNKTGVKSRGLFYGTDKIESIAKMFNWVENTLNIRKDRRSMIYPCEPITYIEQKFDYSRPYDWAIGGYHILQTIEHHYDVIWVELSPFWLSMRVRTYFVTIMLRAAHLGAKKRSPLQALMEVKYCKGSRVALAAFLGGHTIIPASRERAKGYYGYNRGWVVQFQGISPNVGLRKPSTRRECIWFEDGDPTSRLTIKQKQQLQKWAQVSCKKFTFAELSYGN